MGLIALSNTSSFTVIVLVRFPVLSSLLSFAQMMPMRHMMATQQQQQQGAEQAYHHAQQQQQSGQQPRAIYCKYQ